MQYREENMNRYDDRDVIITNLIDSYERLMQFIQKHTNDKFYLEGSHSVSICLLYTSDAADEL